MSNNNNNNSNQPPAPGANFLIPNASVMTNTNNSGGIPPPQQLQMMAQPQLSQQQQAAWMQSVNNNHRPPPANSAASVMNMNIANMNPQQQQALAALKQQVMFRNNAANNNGAVNNASNVAALQAAVHRSTAAAANSSQQQQVAVNSSSQGGTSVRQHQGQQQQQMATQQQGQQKQQQRQQRGGASSSINPMNLTPKQQTALQHHQKSQMIHLQQQLNAQKPAPIMAAMAAAAAAAAQAQAQGQQQQGGQQTQGGNLQQQVAQAYVQAVSQAPGANVQQQQQWNNGQVIQQQQGMVPSQLQQQQGQQQQQQMMYSSTPSAPGTPNTNNSQGGDTTNNNQMPQQQQQQSQQGNQQQLNQQQIHQNQLQIDQNQKQMSQNQQQLNMMRHNVQQEQLKHYHMQATAQNGQQAPSSQTQQQQAPQQQQQLIQQPQNQQVINQLQSFQVQRLRYLQNQKQQQGQVLQQGQVQQGQVMPQSAQQGQVMQQNAQQLSQQQQQQLRSSFQLEALGIGGIGRPPSAMRQSASPMRPPSTQPASRQTSLNLSAPMRPPSAQPASGQTSFSLSVADQQGQVIRQEFYKPLKSSKGVISSQSAGPATSVPVGTESQSSSGQHSSQTNESLAQSSVSEPKNLLDQSVIKPVILSQYLPLGPPTLNNTAAGLESNVVQRRPSQSHKSASSSGKTSTTRQPPHESTLSHDEVKMLASQLSCEEKVVWISKQILGTHGSNGFQKAMSNVQKTKRQRLRQYKKQRQDDTEIDTDDLDRVKVKTMNVRVAEKMIADMNQGLQFCDLMADTIKSILKEIDPNNPLISASSAAPLLLDVQRNPRVADSMAAMHAISSAVSASLQELNKGGGGGGRGDGASSDQMVRPPCIGHGAETVAQGNPQGSTLRKLRKRSSTKFHGDRDLAALIGDHDDNGKKLTKIELSSRLLEATRFRTLNEGDYVAAKVNSQNVWILARVVRQWNEINVPLKVILEMSDIKREALFKEMVFIQMNDEYNGDLSSARTVKRQHILPLARSNEEGNDWGKRLRKGSRVYAIYPKTITFYCATVVDCTTYCRNQDDIIVVEFDGDEDENGNIPQRHIPACFVTLIPREFETNKRRRKSTSGAARRRSSKLAMAPSAAPPILADMLYDPPQHT